MLILVDNRQLVELVLPDDIVCGLERRVVGSGDELFERRHEVADKLATVVARRTVVTGRDDAEELAVAGAVIRDGHAGVARLFLQVHDLLERHVRRERRVGLDKACLVGLDLCDHRSLGLHGL